MAFWTRWKRKQETVDSKTEARTEVKKRYRGDGWSNVLSRIGTERDRRVGGDQPFCADPVSVEEAEQLWLGSDLAAKVIEVLPAETMRPGVTLKGFEKEDAEAVCGVAEELRVHYHLVRAMMYERAYGGAALLPVVNDGAELDTPLGEAAVWTEVEHFMLFQPNELYPVRWYTDATSPKYGDPEVFRLQPISVGGNMASNYGQLIHESRLIVFPGIKVTRRQTNADTYGWGMSVLSRVRSVLRDFEMTWGAVANVVQECSLGVLRMAGLAELIANDEDDVVLDRMIQADMGKSVVGSLVIDKEDEFTRINAQLQGAADMLDRFGTRFATAADMPVSLAIGESARGLNATGEGDRIFWYDRVSRNFDEHRPQIEKAYQFIILATNGPVSGKEPDEWSVEQKPMLEPSEKEKVETRWLVAQTDEKYYNMEVLTSKTIRDSRFGGDSYSIETIVDLTEYAEMDRIAEEAVKLEAEAKKASTEALIQGGGALPGVPPGSVAQAKKPPPVPGKPVPKDAPKPAPKADALDRYWPREDENTKHDPHSGKFAPSGHTTIVKTEHEGGVTRFHAHHGVADPNGRHIGGHAVVRAGEGGKHTVSVHATRNGVEHGALNQPTTHTTAGEAHAHAERQLHQQGERYRKQAGNVPSDGRVHVGPHAKYEQGGRGGEAKSAVNRAELKAAKSASAKAFTLHNNAELLKDPAHRERLRGYHRAAIEAHKKVGGHERVAQHEKMLKEIP